MLGLHIEITALKLLGEWLVQKLFVNNVKSLVAVINEMGNPFTEDSGDLYVLDSKVVMDKSVAESLSTIYDRGLTKYTEYVMCCLKDVPPQL